MTWLPVTLTWLLYNLQLWRYGRWFRKFAVRFRPIRKELESSMYNNKQLLDEVFVISRIIKVEVRVISQSRRLRLITLTETLIILDIAKTESNNCFIYIERKNLEVMFLPFHWRQATRVARSWHDYPWKSCTAVIHDMITRDLDMITRDLDMIIV